MKKTRLLTLAGALGAAGSAFLAAADMPPLGTGLTHYYDFEPERTGTSGKELPASITKNKNNYFNATGMTWNASETNLKANPGITITQEGKKITHGSLSIETDPPMYRGTFGQSLSGGQNNNARFLAADAPFLCPTGDCWTISFWAMRGQVQGNASKILQRLLLVNGVPLNKKDSVTTANLQAESDENQGFGFYTAIDDEGDGLGRVGVRLSEKTGGGYGVRSIISSDPVVWIGNCSKILWHNIMLVRQGESLSLYVDGAREGVTNMAAGSFIEIPGAGAGRAGFYTACGNGGQSPWNALDDIAIWNRALCGDEIAAVAGGEEPLSKMAGQTVGVTHYYDFETNRVTAAVKEDKTLYFNVTGQVWNAESGAFEEDPGITLTAQCKKEGGIGDPDYPKREFGNAFSGGNNNSCFYGSAAPFLCPTGAEWTISFWAMRRTNLNKDEDRKCLLVNGIPLSANNITAEGLGMASVTNEGFGFYMVTNGALMKMGRVGVRLSEMSVDAESGETNCTIRSLLSGREINWAGEFRPTQTNWHNIMLVRDGAALTLYVDGAAQGGTTMTPGSTVEAPAEKGLHSVFPGATQNEKQMGKNNALDDIAIWNRALNPGEREAVSLGAAPVSLMARSPIRTLILIK